MFCSSFWNILLGSDWEMKLVSFLILWTLCGSAGALNCSVCADPSCESQDVRQCSSETMCITVVTRNTTTGISVRNVFKGCASPALCAAPGTQNLVFSEGLSRTAIFTECCGSENCNAVTFTISAVQPARPPGADSGFPTLIPQDQEETGNGLECSTCVRGVCSTIIQCGGIEDRCFTANEDSVPVGGCISANLCEAAARLEAVPFLRTLSGLACCRGTLCNFATLNTTPTTPTTTTTMTPTTTTTTTSMAPTTTTSMAPTTTTSMAPTTTTTMTPTTTTTMTPTTTTTMTPTTTTTMIPTTTTTMIPTTTTTMTPTTTTTMIPTTTTTMTPTTTTTMIPTTTTTMTPTTTTMTPTTTTTMTPTTTTTMTPKTTTTMTPTTTTTMTPKTTTTMTPNSTGVPTQEPNPLRCVFCRRNTEQCPGLLDCEGTLDRCFKTNGEPSQACISEEFCESLNNVVLKEFKGQTPTALICCSSNFCNGVISNTTSPTTTTTSLSTTTTNSTTPNSTIESPNSTTTNSTTPNSTTPNSTTPNLTTTNSTAPNSTTTNSTTTNSTTTNSTTESPASPPPNIPTDLNLVPHLGLRIRIATFEGVSNATIIEAVEKFLKGQLEGKIHTVNVTKMEKAGVGSSKDGS